MGCETHFIHRCRKEAKTKPYDNNNSLHPVLELYLICSEY